MFVWISLANASVTTTSSSRLGCPLSSQPVYERLIRCPEQGQSVEDDEQFNFEVDHEKRNKEREEDLVNFKKKLDSCLNFKL